MEVLPLLRAIPFFSQLRESQLRAMAQICRRESFDAGGEDIIEQGDLTSRFCVVDEGHVYFRETDHEGVERAVGSAGRGQFFGLKMFTSQEPSPYTAAPLEQATVYVMEREDFDRLVQARPDILAALPEIQKERRRLNRGFKWLAPGELVALTTHRHSWTLITALIIPFLVGLLLIAAVFAFSFFGFLRGSLEATVWAGVAALLVAWGLYAIGEWADDDFIVTNKRVAHVDRALVLLATRDEIPINKIQSMTAEQGGLLDILLGVGTLTITSAGSGGTQVLFDRILRPKHVEQVILRQQALLRAREQAIERRRFRRQVATEMRHHFLKQGGVTPVDEEPEIDAVTRGPILKELWQSLFGNEFRRGNTVTWRKHWIGLLGHIRLRLIPLIASLVIASSYFWLPAPSLWENPGFDLALLALFVIGLADFLWGWEDWRNDLYQVTDRLVVDIERWPFGINERQKIAPLMNVQDVSVKRPYFSNAIFNYGNVQVNVAGSGEPLVFYNVARPDDISAEIFRRLDAYRVRKLQRETSVASRGIVDALVAYHLLIEEKKNETGAEGAALPQGDGQGLQPLPGGSQPALGPGSIQAAPQGPAEASALGDDSLEEFPPADETDASDLYEGNL